MTRTKKNKPSKTETKARTKETQQSETVKKHTPDLVFKKVISETVVQMGLQLGPTERGIPASMRDDLLILVPEGVPLQGTIFDFFKAVNLVEFKSENDVTLDEREFLKNVIRVHSLYIQDENLTVEQMLNVYVSSHRPASLIKFMHEHGYEFKATDGRDWLLTSRFGLVDVAIVICEKLPIEPKYYQWLLFAPTNSKTWHDFVVQLLMSSEEYVELTKDVVLMRPKEVNMLIEELREMAEAGELDLQEFEKLDKEHFELIRLMLIDSAKKPHRMKRVADTLEPEQLGQLLKMTSPEKLEAALSNLTPQERAQLISLMQKQTE